MANYPFLKIYTCSETITNVDYLDIDYTSANFLNIPKVIVTTDNDINVFVSNSTSATARINFSTKYTGTVYYTVISK